MADGDILPGRLPVRYQQSYKAICEGKRDRPDIVWNLLKPFLSDIKNHEQTVKYAKHLGEILQAAIENVGKNASVDLPSLNKEIERKVRQAELKHHQEELLLRAVKGIIRDFDRQQRIDTSYLPEAIIERLFQEIYEYSFTGRIPPCPNHHAGMDDATLREYIETIRPDILTQISQWAKKAAVDGDVSKLQLPRRKKVEDIKELVLA